MGIQLVGEDFTERVKRIPPLAWVVIAGVVIGVLVLKGKGGGGVSSAGVTGAGTAGDTSGGGGGGGSSSGGLSEEDLTNFLQAQAQQNKDFQAQIQAIIGGVKPPTSGTTKPPVNLGKLIGYKAVVKGRTPLYNARGHLIGHVSSGTFATSTKVKVGSRWFYRITSGPHKGQLIAYTKTVHFTPTYKK